MVDSPALVGAFLHGMAAGTMLAIGLAVGTSRLNGHVRLAGGLAAVSIAAWLFSESPDLYQAAESIWPLLCALNYPVAGLFWLFVLTVFDERRVTPLTLLPALVLQVSGFVMHAAPEPQAGLIWGARNLIGASLAAHACFAMLRGRRDDLLEARRRFRTLLLTICCVYVLMEVAAGFAFRASHDPRWLMVTVGRPYGGLAMALLAFALTSAFLKVRPAVFGAARRLEVVNDARAEAADRALVEALNGLMAAEAWRREGLTIGDLGADLKTPEHRLRRLINQRLGYRNFADFVNGYRIEAAKRRLADAAEARTTVAAIAFDLGFGSLGPFNRAFRDATGQTPTEWRRQALANGSSELKEAV